MNNLEEYTLDKLMEYKKSLKDKMLKRDAELTILENKKRTIWKEMAKVNSFLRQKCDHEWTRENYIYSPLYCKICYIER